MKAKITSKAFRNKATVPAFSKWADSVSPICAKKLKTPTINRLNLSIFDSGRHNGENINTAIKHSKNPILPKTVSVTDQ